MLKGKQIEHQIFGNVLKIAYDVMPDLMVFERSDYV